MALAWLLERVAQWADLPAIVWHDTWYTYLSWGFCVHSPETRTHCG